MPDLMTIRDAQHVNTLLKSLSSQPPISCSITTNTKKSKGILKVNSNLGFYPSLLILDKKDEYNKGENPSFSFFYRNLNIKFNSKIVQTIENHIRIKIPKKIVITQDRKSDRSNLKSSDCTHIYIPFFKKSFLIKDISIGGICIQTKHEIPYMDRQFNECLLETPNDSFSINVTFRSCMKIENHQWKYGLKIDFLNMLSFYRYLEWVFHLLNPETYTSHYISSHDLFKWFANSFSTLIIKNVSRKKALLNEFKTLDEQNYINSNHCNLAFIRNEKLLSLCMTKRIYNRTFYAQRLVCVPGFHLYDFPKLNIYKSLSEILNHHPACDYLITYKDRDIEWHKRFFQTLVDNFGTQFDISYDVFDYLDMSLLEKFKNLKNVENNEYTCSPCTAIDDFISFTNNYSKDIVNKAYRYNKVTQSTNIFSEILNSTDSSLTRKIFEIKKQSSRIGYAVCEVYKEGYISDESLDICWLFFSSDKLTISVILSDLIPTLSLFFKHRNKKRFRIVWKKQKMKKRYCQLKGKYTKEPCCD